MTLGNDIDRALELIDQNLDKETTEMRITAELARRSTRACLEHVVWPVVEPSRPFIGGYHLDMTAEYLDAVDMGQIRFLLINEPPRHTKSLLSSVSWPIKSWACDPKSRWIFGSYSQDITLRHAGNRRDVLHSKWFTKIWPQAALRPGQDKQEQYGNVSGGYMFATMTGGSVTGLGGRIVLDDPMDPDKADSDTKRRNTNLWIVKTFSSRFDDPKADPFVVIMQRLHPEDTTAFLLDRADWVHLELDALPDEPKTYSFPDGRTITQAAGEPLCPARADVKALRAISRLMDGTPNCDGPYFMSQYRQKPKSSGTDHIKKSWWRFWHYQGSPLPAVTFPSGDIEPYKCACIPLPLEFDAWCQSWDLSADDGKRAADTAGAVFAQRGDDKFVIDLISMRMDFLQQIDAVEQLRSRWPLSAYLTYIENKANGPALIKAKRGEWFGLTPIDPDGSKTQRLREAMPQVRAGQAILPHPDIAPWSLEVVKQCGGEGSKRDVMDVFTQAMKMMRRPVAQLVII
jgi:predicted phage terminase large subunit-like protein